MKKITIIDYDVGNQKSLEIFFKDIGYESTLTNKIEIIKKSQIIILPGIGAFPAAMQSLEDNKLVTLLKDMSTKGIPIIGICLGMQLLATKSYEFVETKGLNLIPGEVKRLKKSNYHIGWNNMNKVNKAAEICFWETDGFFFNHSYYFQGNNKYIITKTNHTQEIPAIIKKKNIYGIQFHPEKSQEVGRNLMINLLGDL